MNKFEADELLNLAIMSKTAYVIVEGIDDIQIYEAISESAQASCEIYSVEMLEGLAGGNEGVIQAIEIIESLNMPAGRSAKDFVVGIIDCDARYYRGEMPAFRSIVSLSAYSIESHFASKLSIKPAIDLLTRISLADRIDVDQIYTSVQSNVVDLYYFSLEALKNAVDPAYQSIVGFSANAGRRKDPNTVTALMAKKDGLDSFASSLHLSRDIESLRKFVKGKWLLTAYAEELFGEIEKLVAKCKEKAIDQCRMCMRDGSAPCLYKVKEGFNKNSLYSILKNFIEIPEFDYLRSAFRSVSATARS